MVKREGDSHWKQHLWLEVVRAAGRHSHEASREGGKVKITKWWQIVLFWHTWAMYLRNI